MTENQTEATHDHTPITPPRGGLRSSKGITDFGIQFGRFVLPADKVLDLIPESLATPIRKPIIQAVGWVSRKILHPETHLQESMNNRLFMNTVDAEGKPWLSEVPEGYLESLFPQGKQEDWPTQLIVCGKDIRPDPEAMRKIMLNIGEIIGDVVGEPVPLANNFDEAARGKTVVIGSYVTEANLLANADALMSRLDVIRKNPLSTEHMAGSAKKAGQMLLDIATLRKDGTGTGTVLRSDAPDIFRHVMTHGFSQGGNIATDIFRYIRHELRSGGYELALDAQGHETIPTDNPNTVRQILSGAHAYMIGGADLPYTREELTELPPRDHSRSDGDRIISLAMGSTKKQANYHANWVQDSPNLARNDRLLETTGPKRAFFDVREASEPGRYHSNLGHGEDHYRHSVVAQGQEPLAERWLPRFKGATIAGDITFGRDMIDIEFDQGTPPGKLAERVTQFAQKLGTEAGIAVESDFFPANPYHLQLRANATPETLRHIRDALQESGIGASAEVANALDFDRATEWLKERLSKLPHTQISLTAKEQGPMFVFSPSDAPENAGTQMHKMLGRGLERIGISTENRRTLDGSAVEVPLHDVVDAMKNYANRERAAGQAR